MESKHQICPSFLKLLMEEDFRKQIRIPNSFTRDFKKKLSRKCILKNTAGKKSWPVRICRRGNDFYICKNAWPTFVKDHKLKYGDYVLFLFVKKRTFEVITYGADCNRKFDLSVNDDKESNDSSSESDEEFDSLEEDDDSYEYDDEDRSISDKDVNGDFDPLKRQSSNKKSKRSSRHNSGKVAKKENEKDDIEEEEEETTCAFGCYYRTNLKNPYFVKKLKPSHKTHMAIPTGFAKQTNLSGNGKFALHGEDKRKWTVKIRTTRGAVLFGEGWAKFFNGYKVKIGDKCKFTLRRSLGNVFSVEIMSQ